MSECYGIGLNPRNPSPLDRFRKFRNKGKLASGYLFLGSEPFYRDRWRKVIETILRVGQPDGAEKTVIDLKEKSLGLLIEEARTLALFTSDRLVIGRNAEQVIPRRGSKGSPELDLIPGYFKDPEPGVVLVIEAVQLDLGDWKSKDRIKRVQEFFAAVPEHVELPALSDADVETVTRGLAKRLGLEIQTDVLGNLVDMLSGDLFRVENELKKLSIYSWDSGGLTPEELQLLVPEARHSGLFEFVNSLAERNQRQALLLLDTMSKEGMYWPLQLNLIAGLFRLALAVKELDRSGYGGGTSQLKRFDIHVPQFRARQVELVASKFRKQELRKALIAFYEADRDLRMVNPDERIIMEMLVMKLTTVE